MRGIVVRGTPEAAAQGRSCPGLRFFSGGTEVTNLGRGDPALFQGRRVTRFLMDPTWQRRRAQNSSVQHPFSASRRAPRFGSRDSL